MIEKGTVFVSGLAVVLPIVVLLVNGFAADSFKEFTRGLLAAGDEIDPFDQPFSDGVPKCNAMVRPTLGIALLFDFAKELVEPAGGTAVGRNDGKLIAPLDTTFGHGIKLKLIFMEGEFIQLDMAVFAGKRVWMRGKAVNAPAAGEPEDISFDVAFAVNEASSQVFGETIEGTSPALALVQILNGGIFVT